MSVRIILADDHPMFLQGLKRLLERADFEVVGEAGDGREAVRLATEKRPDVAILDLAMPLLNGVDAAREIGKAAPGTKTIILTTYSEDQCVREAMRAGVSGYLLKTKAASDLMQAIREVSQGTIYLGEGLSRDLLQLQPEAGGGRENPLSGRERQVLQLIAEGKKIKEIAAILGVSVKTIETHRMRLMDKLDIHETAGLVRYAIRMGIIHV
ncbi:MAG TPA: response regulator transcription factor [Candidatus Polarisedimenticolia bacterium]|jgi:DNA-binding NarL/FixJ family response regulator|nr:response regulator transcription factor [Candidatus Polarisedimenticolia bacterium]